jgi:hypothetical protein
MSLLTFDNARQSSYSTGDAVGKPLGQRYSTHDGRTVDSTGAFLVGELERLDQTLHEPLVSVTWPRDIDLREDVSLADEVTSFTLSTYGAPGGLGTGNSIGNGKSWAGKDTTQITNTSLDIAKYTFPLNIWAQEVKFTIPELESAIRLGRPIDQQKFSALKMKHQMDIDEMVYIGDTGYGLKGLVNQPNTVVANVGNVANGGGGSPLWSTKSPDEILADVNTLLTSTWGNTGWSVMSGELRLPPVQYGQITTQKIGTSGSTSVLKYIEENNLMTTGTGRKLRVLPLKWLIGAGAGGTVGTEGAYDRMMLYDKNKDRVCYPMTLLQKTPTQYDGLYHKVVYFCRLGAVETRYGSVMGYADGL